MTSTRAWLEAWLPTSGRSSSRAVSATGGHLGSNLGVVELTLALHRVFDSPRDHIVWDTGHQAYVHKIVTGRAADFRPLRRAERAVGVRQPGRVRARPGGEQPRLDGALVCLRTGPGPRACAGGPSTSWPWSGTARSPGGWPMRRSTTSVRTAPGWSSCSTTTAGPTPRRSRRLTTAGHARRTHAAAPAAFFEALGIGYAGPVDGHDFAALERRIATARPERPDRSVLHVHTEKGRGYRTGRARRGEAAARHRPLRPRHRRGTRPGAPRPVPASPRPSGTALVREAAASSRADGDHGGHARIRADCSSSPAATPIASSTWASPSSTR